MSNIQYSESPRTVYVSDAGDDANSGLDPINAVRTIGRATAVVTDPDIIDPPPSLFAPAAIVGTPGSRFIENVVQPDNVQMSFEGCSLQGIGGTTFEAGENAQATFLTISNSPSSGDIAYTTNGKSRVSIDARAILLNGPNQTGVLVNRATSEAFQNIGQTLARFDNSVCVDYQATGAKARRLAYNEINMEGSNCIGVRYNASATDVAAFECGAITTEGAGTNNIGIQASQGQLSGYVAEIRCKDALISDNTGHLDINSPNINGDISCNGPSSEINAIITHHESGSVFNCGGISGLINGVEYGFYVDGTELVAPFFLEGNIPGSATQMGSLTIDTTNDTVNAADILASYNQSTPSNRGVTFRVVDADTPSTVYFSGNTTSATPDPNQKVTLSAVTALPANQQVNMIVDVERVTGGLFGVFDARLQIQFTRT